MSDLRRFMFENVYFNPKAKGEEKKAIHMIRQLFDRDLSQSTVRYCQRILSVSLGCAVKYGYIDTNPAKNIITKFSKTSNVPDPYTIPQLQQFFAIVAGTKWEFPVVIAALYGLRISEILGLRWRNVDLEALELRVVEQLPYGLEKGVHEISEMAPVKSKEAGQGRTLPITEVSLRFFLRQKARTADRRRNERDRLFRRGHVVARLFGCLDDPPHFLPDACVYHRRDIDVDRVPCEMFRYALYDVLGNARDDLVAVEIARDLVRHELARGAAEEYADRAEAEAADDAYDDLAVLRPKVLQNLHDVH